MANFFDNVVNKGNALVEQTKLNSELSSLRSQIQANFNSLGQMYYDSKRKENGPSEADLENLMGSIDQQMLTEKDLEKRIALSKGDVICPKCQSPVKIGNRFCPVCGNEMPKEQVMMQPQSMAAGFCTGCGAPLNAGAKFCTKCGKPTDTPAAPAQVPVQNVQEYAAPEANAVSAAAQGADAVSEAAYDAQNAADTVQEVSREN